MNLLGIGPGELLLILLIVLLVMGPERIPELARRWARFTRKVSEFTRAWQEFNAELNRQINLEDLEGRPPARRSAPPPPDPVQTIAPPGLQQAPEAEKPQPPEEPSPEAVQAEAPVEPLPEAGDE